MLNPARCLLRLTADAAEALLYLIDFSNGADELWDNAERLAEAEAAEEVSEPYYTVTYEGPVSSHVLPEVLEGAGLPPHPHEATAVAPQVSADSATAVHPSCSADPLSVEQEGLQLTRDDLLYAAAGIRAFAFDGSLDPYFYEGLADRLCAAASSMK